jgi:hypothetical protein
MKNPSCLMDYNIFITVIPFQNFGQIHQQEHVDIFKFFDFYNSLFQTI